MQFLRLAPSRTPLKSAERHAKLRPEAPKECWGSHPTESPLHGNNHGPEQPAPFHGSDPAIDPEINKLEGALEDARQLIHRLRKQLLLLRI